jgi:STE24 endopeptidase
VFFFAKKNQKAFVTCACAAGKYRDSASKSFLLLFYKKEVLALCFAFFAFPALAASFDPQAATEAYLKSIPAAARLKSDAYFEGGYWLILWNALYNVVVYIILLATGLSARLRDLAFQIGRRTWPGIAIYAVLFTLVAALLTLPLDIYQGYIREHAYDLSNQTFPAWLTDTLIQLAVSMVLAAIVLPIIYAVIRNAPRLWWLWGTGVVMGFLTIIVLVSPVFLEPLLNHFQSLPDGPVRTQILAMAHADGVPAHDVLEFDSSRQTSRISAHVSGLFGTTQISLTDNLIKQCTPDEVLAVLGHEMGHYVMGHVFSFLLSLSLIVAGAFAVARWVFAAVIGRFGAGWGVAGIADPAGLPLLAAAFTVYFFLMTPVLNSLTRAQEMQADIFGLNLARRPDAFATVALKLSTYRKLDPSPWEERIFYDHPSGRTRIMTAMRWKAEMMPP